MDSQLTSSSVKGAELELRNCPRGSVFRSKGVFLSLWLVSRYKKR